MSATSIRRSDRVARPTAKNVYHHPLKQHSVNPPTGFFRDGFCDTDPADVGNHTVAGQLTPEFLEFTSKRGNNLNRVPGLHPYSRWCLCAGRWKEAYDAYKRGELGRHGVPPVDLAATHMRALNTLKLDEMKEFAVPDGEGASKDEEEVYHGIRDEDGRKTSRVGGVKVEWKA
ncbi:hypothetical protein L211DRAFT_837399 [Terfezia boudieri ATCC MYA-4762]|uniref:Uncharacterized protein n=1 Tax=Terfezia boudieri ATCC MYA-4762 TaxID=1051890 RepID=A0A3N4LNJ7_9PEZI|nr:hypothetical protein L211DRAFT_837399 [Terfezia boudieri ATCC MYA-4762]